MEFDEILRRVCDLTDEEAGRLFDELRRSHSGLFSTKTDHPMGSETITLPRTEFDEVIGGAVAIIEREAARQQRDDTLIQKQQQLVEKQSDLLCRLRPLLEQLLPEAKTLTSCAVELMRELRVIRRKRRELKSGTIDIMRQVASFRRERLKWDVVHKRMLAVPGYKISTPEALRLRFSKVTKHPDWAQA